MADSGSVVSVRASPALEPRLSARLESRGGLKGAGPSPETWSEKKTRWRATQQVRLAALRAPQGRLDPSHAASAAAHTAPSAGTVEAPPSRPTLSDSVTRSNRTRFSARTGLHHRYERRAACGGSDVPARTRPPVVRPISSNDTLLVLSNGQEIPGLRRGPATATYPLARW